MNNSNNSIDKLEHYNHLFDYYGSLLTDKQQKYFHDYYFDDLTISEIAKNNNISRSAVFDAISKIHDVLDEYETILSLYKKDCEREKIYNEYLNKTDNILVHELINKMKEIE